LRHYSYYPGCSSHASAAEYDSSAKLVMQALDTKLEEISDWNCCGATVLSGENYLFSLLAGARNLALLDGDLVTGCNSCYVTLNRVKKAYSGSEEWQEKIDEGLREIGQSLNVKEQKVRHLLQVLYEDIGLLGLGARVSRPLEGLRLAPYYGCQYSRPQYSYSHPESPMELEEVLALCGAEVVEFDHKTKCCGSSLMTTKEEQALDLCGDILEEANLKGVDAIVTICPLCQLNLDAFQPRVNGLLNKQYSIPVLFFTQVLGMAFGYSPEEVQLSSSLTPVGDFLVRYKEGGLVR